MTLYSWSSRTATRSCAPSSSTSAASIRCGWCRSCITTARRSPRASSPSRSASISPRSKSRRCARWCHEKRARTSPIPSPLWGWSARSAGVGVVVEIADRAASNHIYPHPDRLRFASAIDPPHKGEGKRRPTMTYIAKPKFHHPGLPKNELGYTHRDYEGKISTLCAGCGHDSITGAIIEACFDLSIEPHRVAKISGIGCSSKTPDYFLGNSHGFNTVHGRMPSVLTGANLANRDLIYLGVSGDGDSASIGFGQFAHAIRRGVNMTYIVENNGVYGLTKGQFSATADRGSKSKRGVTNSDNAIDLVAIALQLGASFVARSFSGDKSQLVPLIEAAIKHQGASFIDVISPCVAFNNHTGSTKSFDYVREHNETVNRLDVITGRAPITVDYAPGTVQVVEQHDGTRLALRKLDADYDVHDRLAAMAFLQKHAAKGQVVTGLLYVDPEADDLHANLNTVDTPLNSLEAKDVCPGSAALEKINASLR